MQNSHCNNGSLGLTYLTTLPRPNDLEFFSQKGQGHKVAVNQLNRSMPNRCLSFPALWCLQPNLCWNKQFTHMQNQSSSPIKNGLWTFGYCFLVSCLQHSKHTSTRPDFNGSNPGSPVLLYHSKFGQILILFLPFSKEYIGGANQLRNTEYATNLWHTSCTSACKSSIQV